MAKPQVTGFFGQPMRASKTATISNATRAFIAPIRNGKNLRILTEAQTERIQIEEGRATGIDFLLDGHPASATGEVVLSAVTIWTPQLLQRSGIDAGERPLRVPHHRVRTLTA